MAGKSSKTLDAKKGDSREDRLKVALKANLARRKQQARARSGPEAGEKDKTKE